MVMLNAYASSGGDEIVTAYVPATASKPASHQNLVRFFHETEVGAGEYDVVFDRTADEASATVSDGYKNDYACPSGYSCDV